jgi:hypothetical protein
VGLLATAIAARDRAIETEDPRDWRQAFELLSELVKLRGTKEAEFELGNVAAHIEREDEAYAAYEQALALGLSGRAAAQAQAFVAGMHDRIGWLSVVGPAGASLYVRGRQRGVLPLPKPLPVVMGEALVSVEVSGLSAWKTRVVVVAGTTSALRAELGAPAVATGDPASARSPEKLGSAASTPRWGLPTAIAGGAVLAAGIGTVVGTTLALSSKREDLARNCLTLVDDQCLNATSAERDAAQADADAIAALKTARGVAIGASAVGGVALAAGLYVLLQKPTGTGRARGPTALVSQHGAMLLWEESL